MDSGKEKMVNLEDYRKYLLFPTQENLGIFADERFIADNIKNPYGITLVHHSDPAYLTGGKALFSRHGLPYPKGILHAGMWKFEESDDYELLVGDNVIGIEANPYVYATFSKPIADIHNFVCENFAVWNEDGEILTLYYDDVRMDCSTLFDPSKPKSFQVQTKTLDTYVAENNIDMRNYNCVNIDIEGAELQALEGFENNIQYVDYLMLETSLNDKFNSGSDLQILENYLKERGFELVEIDSKFANYGWGDAFFVRRT